MKKILSYGLAAAVLAMICPGVSLAAPMWLTGEKISLDRAVTDDAYVIGESMSLDKDIAGDLVVMGGDVVVNGTVSGDIWAVGGNLTINGRVGDDLRLAGGDVTVAGSVTDDLTGAGGSLTIADTARVGGDLRVAAGDFTLYGTVVGDANLWTGQTRINGQISGNANVHVSENLSFGKEGRVAKKLSYWAAREDGNIAQYAKEVEFHRSIDANTTKKGLATLLTAAGISLVIWKWLSMILLGAVLIWVAPKYLPHLADTLRARQLSGKYLVNGLVLMFVVPLLLVLFAITVVGFPLSAVIFFGYMLLLVLGYLVGAYGLGSYLRGHRHDNEWQQLANLGLGMLVLMAGLYIPLLGWILQMLVLIYGLGAVWHDKMRMLANYRKGA